MSMEIISDFIAAMEAAGVRPLEPLSQRLEDGKLIRFRSEGDKPGKLNGWAVLHLDGLAAGAFGNYRMGISEKWRAGKVISLTPIQRREIASAIRREQELRASERLQRQERAAAEVRNEWQRARDADPAHGYLRRKGISGEGLKQVGHWLLVPMHDPEGRLWNIQRIAPDGTGCIPFPVAVDFSGLADQPE